jgi:hypothetical protein
MQKKLTLSIDAEIYEALHKVAGKRKIGRFIEKLVRPYLGSLASVEPQKFTTIGDDQETAPYGWAETCFGDPRDEAR